MQKECAKCKKTLPITNFSKRLRSKDGYQFSCKDCDKIARQQYKTLKERDAKYQCASNIYNDISKNTDPGFTKEEFITWAKTKETNLCPFTHTNLYLNNLKPTKKMKFIPKSDDKTLENWVPVSEIIYKLNKKLSYKEIQELLL